MFLNDFACESFILAHRLDGLDGFLMGSTIDNNYFFALLREAGNEVSVCQKKIKNDTKNPTLYEQGMRAMRIWR